MTQLSAAAPFAESRARVEKTESAEANRRDAFVLVFEESYEPLHRYLNRLSGDTDFASELAQEAFVRLYRRRSPPDDPAAWLFTVATNLFRNAKVKQANRARLLSAQRGLLSHSDPVKAPDEENEADETKRRVRITLDGLSDREKSLLLLAAEGYSYREVSAILRLKPSSVGTLLRRARAAFRKAYEETRNAR